MRLDFAPWDAYYVVFNPLEGPGQQAELVSTNAESLAVVSRRPDAIEVRASAPATQHDLDVTMRADGRTYKARAPISELKPIALGGDWDFRPEPARVGVPYAKVQDAEEGEGEKLGWAHAEFDDAQWPSLWLSEAENTIRNWNVIGPFPNADDAGFETAYPPETEPGSANPAQAGVRPVIPANAGIQPVIPAQAGIQPVIPANAGIQPVIPANAGIHLAKTYSGLHGNPVGWKRYYGDEPFLTLGHWNIWMQTEGGPFDDSAHIVQFNRVLDTEGQSWITSYALTYLYSPKDQQAKFVVAADNCLKVWLNHQQVFARLRHPFWYEMNDNWADQMPVNLRAGWNEVLLKVGLGRGPRADITDSLSVLRTSKAKRCAGLSRACCLLKCRAPPISTL